MKTENRLHIPMGTATRRIIFFTLLTLFGVYTFFIAGSLTDTDNDNIALTSQAKKGKLIFQKYNCISCHQIYGLGGYMGPDLTNVMSERGKGLEYVRAFLKSGTDRMPDFHLTEQEVSELSAFLNYIDKTGSSPVRKFAVCPDGNITIFNEK